MKRSLILLAGLALGTSAFAQQFNIDVGINDATYPLPAATFSAATTQTGVWNDVDGLQGTTPLVDISGAATAVSIACVGAASYNFSFDNTGTLGDDHNFMDDASDPTSTGATWTISGLAAGNYVLYTYAWAPDNATFFSNVSVPGSSDPVQAVGGAWPGGYSAGVTHAVHHITVAGGGSVGMTITVSVSFATLNGFQLLFDNPPVGFCDPGAGGVMSCPCSNAPSGAGRGCDNSSATGGATISASGSSVLGSDTLVLTTADQRPTGSSIVMQGTTNNGTGLPFGQGVRCVAGTLKRLYLKTAASGSISAPGGGDPSVSAQSSTLGDPILSGQHRYYMVYYRDPNVLGGCPAASTYNCTAAVDVTWQ